jgi:purine-binding chemotaxis protein CheW
MSGQPYVIFELNGAPYGILASAVQELFFLPEITSIAEAPPSVVGVINLRGEILSVVSLHQRLGLKPAPYQLTDSMIVVQWRSERVGIIVNQICEVKSIDNIQSGLALQLPALKAAHCVSGIAHVEEAIITLLNPEQLVQLAAATSVDHTSTQNGHRNKYHNEHHNEHQNEYHNEVAYQAGDQARNQAGDQTVQRRSETGDLYAHLSPEARQTFQERSENLRRSLDNQDAAGLIPLAVMGLAGEYLGLGLTTVYEFTEIYKIAPVPCCPPHILGNINLRGEIVTLVDICSVINLPARQPSRIQKAIVVRMDELTAGIAVDEIFDVVYIDPSQILVAPVASQASNDEYLQGVALYRGKMMSIIDLPRLLRSGALVVNEEV